MSAILSGFTRKVLKAQTVALTVLEDYGNDPQAYGDRLDAICADAGVRTADVEEQLFTLSGDAQKEAKQKAKKRAAYARAA